MYNFAHATRKSETSMRTVEADARALIDNQLREKGWGDSQVVREGARHADERRALGRARPDYVLYPRNAARPVAVIEAKRRGRRLADALRQGAEYARKLQCPIVLASDGDSARTLHLGDGGALRVNGEELREIPAEKTLLRFRESSAWTRGEVVRSSRGLVSIFNQAGKALLAEGLANIDAFAEFSQILFFKVVSEISDDEESRAPPPAHWRDIENLAGPALLRRYAEGVKLLEARYPGVFGETQIRRPAALEAIVAKLRGYSFIDVDADVKGEAYEYFLRRYNRQKSGLAQYFTPRHVVRAMVGLADPKFGEKVYDPFCGTGGMLIQAFKHIRRSAPPAPDAAAKRRREDILQNRSVYGADISRSAQTAKMNMILAGDGHSNILRADSLARDPGGKYDAVITNIPFSQSEIACLRHCLAAAAGRRGGRVCVVVPERILDSSKPDYVRLRADLLREWTVRRVVSLPREVFRGLTAAKTSVIFAEWGDGRGGEKPPARKVSIPYFTVENDGFTLDKKRAPLPGDSDLDRLLEDRDEGALCEAHAVRGGLWTMKPKAEARVESGFPTRPLGDLVEPQKRRVDITPDMICREPGLDGKAHRIRLREEQFGYNVGVTRRWKILPGDLVFARMHTQDGLFAFSDAEYHSAGTQLICRVRESEADRDFLFWALDRMVPKLSAVDTTGRESYSEEQILSLPIPCPPLARQREMVRALKRAAAAAARARENLEKARDDFGRRLAKG